MTLKVNSRIRRTKKSTKGGTCKNKNAPKPKMIGRKSKSNKNKKLTKGGHGSPFDKVQYDKFSLDPMEQARIQAIDKVKNLLNKLDEKRRKRQPQDDEDYEKIAELLLHCRDKLEMNWGDHAILQSAHGQIKSFYKQIQEDEEFCNLHPYLPECE